MQIPWKILSNCPWSSELYLLLYVSIKPRLFFSDSHLEGNPCLVFQQQGDTKDANRNNNNTFYCRGSRISFPVFRINRREFFFLNLALFVTINERREYLFFPNSFLVVACFSIYLSLFLWHAGSRFGTSGVRPKILKRLVGWTFRSDREKRIEKKKRRDKKISVFVVPPSG